MNSKAWKTEVCKPEELNTKDNFDRVWSGHIKLDDVPEESKWWSSKECVEQSINKLSIRVDSDYYFKGSYAPLISTDKRRKSLLDASIGTSLFQLNKFYSKAKNQVDNKYASDFILYYEDNLAEVNEKYEKFYGW